MGFEDEDDLDKEFQANQVINIEMTKDTVLISDNIVYNIDDSVKDICLESKYVKYNVKKDLVYSPMRQVWNIYSYQDTDRLLRLFTEDVKNKKKRDYNELLESKINVTVSKKNYNILIENYSDYLSE